MGSGPLAREQAGFQIDYAIELGTGPADALLQLLLQGQIVIDGAPRRSPAVRLLGQQQEVIAATLQRDDVLDRRSVDFLLGEQQRALDQNRWLSAAQNSAPQTRQVGDIGDQAAQFGQQCEAVGLQRRVIDHHHDLIEKRIE